MSFYCSIGFSSHFTPSATQGQKAGAAGVRIRERFPGAEEGFPGCWFGEGVALILQLVRVPLGPIDCPAPAHIGRLEEEIRADMGLFGLSLFLFFLSFGW